MTRLATCFLCAITALGGALVSARQDSTFSAGTNTVSVYATVLDEEGHLLTDLRKDEFEVYDNGVKQELTVFTNDIQPITIVIMLDRSSSMERNFGLVRKGAEAFVANLLKGDRAKVGSFSDRVQIDPAVFTSDQDELVGILREKLQPAGLTPLWNATAAAMNALSREPGRRVVLVFTDGINAPDWDTANVTISQVRSRSQAEGVMIYAIGLADICEPASGSTSLPGMPRYQGGGPSGRRPGGSGRGPIGRFPIPRGPIGGNPFPPGPRGPVGSPPPVDLPRSGDTGRTGSDDDHRKPCYDSKPDPELRPLASATGGGYYELKDTDQLSATFARIADELHHQYLLAFAPPVLDGTMHQLEVRTSRRGALVRARQSYLAQSEPVAVPTSTSKRVSITNLSSAAQN